jgi:hypothetical protein
VHLTPEGGSPVVMTYDEINSFDVGGPGAVKSGTRLWGGGFGLQGAAEGMLAASVINSLTSKVRVETVLTVRATLRGFVVVYAQETPEQLRIRLAGAIAQIEGRQRTASTSGETSVPDQLARLHELHSQGGLTDEEYATAKAKLIERI